MTREAPAELVELEARVQRALRGQADAVEVLGYGEISPVLALDAADGAKAAKRLPTFPHRASLRAYARVFEDYLAALRAAGVSVVPSELMVIEGAEPIAYCVQPRLDAQRLVPSRLAQADASQVVALFERLVDRVSRAVSATVGLDAQASNWVWLDGEPHYLDVTTPLMRDPSGAERLDTSLFLASLPAALRPVVRRLLLRDILDKYYDPRGVLLDLAGNLHKEQLEGQLPALLAAIHARLPEVAPLTPREVLRYYRSDARTWELLQRLRRLDRRWQERVRRRVYPFLLPAEVARHV